MTDELLYRFIIFLLFAFVVLTDLCLTHICFKYRNRITALEEKVKKISQIQFIINKDKLDKSCKEFVEAFEEVINRDDG